MTTDELVRQYKAGQITRRELVRDLMLLGLSGSSIGAVLVGDTVAASQLKAASPPRPKRGGTVVVGVYQEANSLNWLLTGGPFSFATMELFPMFEPMLRVNTKGELEPALLAEVPTLKNHGISADGLTYTLRLRPGLKWADGHPCTMRDWAFTWKWIMNPKNGAQITSGWNKIASIQVKNDTTAIVKLHELYVPFLADVLPDLPMLPEHVQSTMTTQAFGRKPVGNGPFKFVEWVSGDHITMERNPLYWREPKAWLDRIIFKVVPDRNTVIAQAKTGDIDIGADYTEAQIPEMSTVPSVTLSITHPPIYERYHFTMVTAEDIKKPHPIFGDIRVRKAVTLAIDRQTIINKILFGKTKIAKNELDNTPYENTAITPDPFDPRQAMALLDEAGWKPGPDGMRAKGGVRLSVTHGTTAGNQTRETIQALVQANLKDVGIEMKIANAPASTFFGSFAEGGGAWSRKLDMVGFTDGLQTTDPNIRLDWHSEEIPTKEHPHGNNASGLADPALDKLLDAQLKELDDAKRKELLLKAQKIIHDDYPMVPMYDRSNINTIHKRTHGVHPTDFAGITGVCWNTEQWWVE